MSKFLTDTLTKTSQNIFVAYSFVSEQSLKKIYKKIEFFSFRGG